MSAAILYNVKLITKSMSLWKVVVLDHFMYLGKNTAVHVLKNYSQLPSRHLFWNQYKYISSNFLCCHLVDISEITPNVIQHEYLLSAIIWCAFCVWQNSARCEWHLKFLSPLCFPVNLGMNTDVHVMTNCSMPLSHGYFENYLQVYIINKYFSIAI